MVSAISWLAEGLGSGFKAACGLRRILSRQELRHPQPHCQSAPVARESGHGNILLMVCLGMGDAELFPALGRASNDNEGNGVFSERSKGTEHEYLLGCMFGE